MGFLTDIEFEDDGLEFEDRGRKKIHNAFDIEPECIERAWIQHRGIGLLQLNIMGADPDGGAVNEDLFDKKAAYLLYDWIATHIRERAFVIGLKAEYMVARILLRTSLEARMTGIFMNSLANESFREEFRNVFHSRDAEELRRIFQGSNPTEVLDTISATNLESTAKILDIINKTDNQEFHNIHNGLVRDILDKHYYFEPKTKLNIKQCYSGLNPSVHAHIDESLVERSLRQHGNPFDAPSHSKDGLRSFLEQYQDILDIDGVLMLNEFESDIRRTDKIMNLLNDSNYQLPGLDDTRSKLETIRTG